MDEKLRDLLEAVLKLNNALNSYWHETERSSEPLCPVMKKHCREIIEAQNLAVALGAELALPNAPASGRRH